MYYNSQIIIICIYIPTNSPAELFNRHCIQIEDLRFSYPDVTFLIVGDFNLPDVKWPNRDYHPTITGSTSEKSKILAQTIAFMQLFQLNHIVNYKITILDLVISNDISVVVTKYSFPLVSIDSAHPPF